MPRHLDLHVLYVTLLFALTGAAISSPLVRAALLLLPPQGMIAFGVMDRRRPRGDERDQERKRASLGYLATNELVVVVVAATALALGSLIA
jgi:hypothetical protein